MAAPTLSPALRQQLDAIEPSQFNPQISLHPCSAQLRDGRTLDRVYVTETSVFKRLQGWESPEEARVNWISPADVVSIKDSPVRLPARFANKVYQAGESGMGFNAFTVKFKWWARRYYEQGVVDFLEYPRWQGPATVKDVVEHARRRKVPSAAPGFYFCVYSD